MSRLLLIRHGETAHNANGRLSTAAPGGGLSERGRGQVEALAAELAGAPLEAVYASPLLRARQTAERIAARHGLPVVCLDDLAEIGVGELDGRSDEDAFAVLNHALDSWCRGDYAVRVGRDGELGSAVRDRFARLVEWVAARHPRGPVALVGHGGLLQVGVACCSENLPAGFAVGRLLRNCGLIELQATAGAMRCVSWDGSNPDDLLEG